MRALQFGLFAALLVAPPMSLPKPAHAQSAQPTFAPASQPTSQPEIEPSTEPSNAEAQTATPRVVDAEASASVVPDGYDVLLHVEGMVCQFCASGIERLMDREDHVDGFDVDFDGAVVLVSIVDGQTLSDEDFERIIRRAGYTLTGLERAE
ncbi:MAG: copper chaperone CopZ [Bradymonadia bacterium]|jgi:copper chaperone CopZ